MTRRLWIAAATVLVAALGFTLATLPPAPTALAVPRPSTTLLGAYHVHTTRSDGSGTIGDVAAAAARAGLQFVIVTDHGDATRPPDAPAYHNGVLVIDAVEISTRDGHVVALGLIGPSPYPLGGEGRDVIEDVRRLRGWTVAAHPDSTKDGLRWRGPATDAIEWINADSEWRDDPPRTVVLTAAHALFRPAAAITALFRPPSQTWRRWNTWARTGLIPGLAAVDAHANISVGEHDEPRVSRTLFARPTYEDMFRTLVQGVWLPAPPTGDAAADAAAVLDAMREGRTYSAVHGLASPALLNVAISNTTLTASVDGAGDARLTVWVGDREAATGLGRVQAPTGSPGLYRVTATWPGSEVPWIVSAPLFVAAGDAPSTAPETTSSDAQAPGLHLASDGIWTVEHDPASTASWSTEGEATVFTFALAGGAARSQFAAVAHALTPTDSFEAIRFTVSADRPRRFSVQVRMPSASADGERWVRSVYADQWPREIVLRLSDFAPAVPTSRRPIAARLQSLLFVVDGPNTPPGTRGQITLRDVTLIPPTTPAGPLDATSARSAATQAPRR